MSVLTVKSASSLGQTVGVGAGSGAAAGALVTMFSENPNLRSLAKNVLVGGAGGAAIGGGIHTLGNVVGAKEAPPEMAAPAPKPAAAPAPRNMNLGVAALSGMAPLGIGAAIHGGVSQGYGQAAGSGAAALAPSVLVTLIQQLRGKPAGTPGTRAVSTIGSMLASVGAAHAGNKMREN